MIPANKRRVVIAMSIVRVRDHLRYVSFFVFTSFRRCFDHFGGGVVVEIGFDVGFPAFGR